MSKHTKETEVEAMAETEENITEVETPKAKKAVKAEKPAPISDAEWERRTKLDVANPDYINPSLDHYK